MTRPTRPTIDNGDIAWDAPANDANIQLYNRPAPIGELHAGTLASLDSARVPSTYDQCLAWAWFGAAADSGFVPVLNNGTNWVPISNWIAARKKITGITDTYTVLDADDVVVVTGANTFDLTLPSLDVANEGREIEFKQFGTGTVTLKGTIDGVVDLDLTIQNESICLRSLGSGSWMKVGSFHKRTFKNLLDSPASYSGQAGKLVAVNSSESAVKFVDPQTIPLIIAIGDETTVLTTGTGKVTFRVPAAFTVTGVRASLTTASATGTLTVDINEGGTSILSTKLTIDATEKTSETAAVAAVISDADLADDAEITIDIDDAGSSADAAGLKVTILGTM